MKVTAEEIERVLAAHTVVWDGSRHVCDCMKRFITVSHHRAHVAAQILKLLESKEGEGG